LADKPKPQNAVRVTYAVVVDGFLRDVDAVARCAVDFDGKQKAWVVWRQGWVSLELGARRKCATGPHAEATWSRPTVLKLHRGEVVFGNTQHNRAARSGILFRGILLFLPIFPGSVSVESQD
jgi:hypothetical protein